MEYITGNKFKNFCNFHFDGRELVLNNPQKNGEPIKIFVKTDFINVFFKKIDLNQQFVLFTHNSDLEINSSHLKYLDHPNLVAWYGQNINTTHSKLKSIPIGIANEEWPHGNVSEIETSRNKNFKKTNLIYANFNTKTNLRERNHCVSNLIKNNIQISKSIKFKEYTEELARSYFSICPNGNGLDCHRTWESLYLRTVPVVTKSINSLQYKNLPILIIDDWSNFLISNFTLELYESLWYNFNIENLSFTNYVSRILHP